MRFFIATAVYVSFLAERDRFYHRTFFQELKWGREYQARENERKHVWSK